MGQAKLESEMQQKGMGHPEGEQNSQEEKQEGATKIMATFKEGKMLSDFVLKVETSPQGELCSLQK